MNYNTFLEFCALLFLALSFVALVASVQSFRYGSRAEEKNKGFFPLTFLTCFSLLAQALARSSELLLPGSEGAGPVFRKFQEIYVKNKLSASREDLLRKLWKGLKDKAFVHHFLLKVIFLSFSIYILMFRVALGSFKVENENSRVKKAITMVLFASLFAMAAYSCQDGIRSILPQIDPVEDPNSIFKLSETFNQCLKGPMGIDDALVTISLLHASFSWSVSSSVGIQHVLFFRWASSVLELLQLSMEKNILQDFLSPKVKSDRQLEIAALLLQIVPVLLFFVAKFARKQPITFAFVVSALTACFAVALSDAVPDLATLAALHESLGQAVTLLLLLAIFFSGGFGISLASFVLVRTAHLNMPEAIPINEVLKM